MKCNVDVEWRWQRSWGCNGAIEGCVPTPIKLFLSSQRQMQTNKHFVPTCHIHSSFPLCRHLFSSLRMETNANKHAESGSCIKSKHPRHKYKQTNTSCQPPFRLFVNLWLGTVRKSQVQLGTVLKRPLMCYIFEKHALWGYQIWYWEVCLGNHLGHVWVVKATWQGPFVFFAVFIFSYFFIGPR